MKSVSSITMAKEEESLRGVSILAILRFSGLGGLLILAFGSPEAGKVILQSCADAFLQVTVFVALTFLIFYSLEQKFGVDLADILKKRKVWQVPVAAFLGALPGCGGAVVVITQHIRGGISFGSVVAVLTATMGDAAFLLLAQAPVIGVGVFLICFFVGILSGFVVDYIHSDDFMQKPSGAKLLNHRAILRSVDNKKWQIAWIGIFMPCVIFGFLVAFQADTMSIFGSFYGFETIVWAGFAGAIISLFLWCFILPAEAKVNYSSQTDLSKIRHSRGVISRVIGDTCFVTAWVIFAYIVYELWVLYSGVSLASAFSVWAPIIPLVAILIGLIPGCGPQVIVATMYLNGSIPLSAELGNAISNDGDALFPAIIMAPRVALMATLYSTVPAFVVAYIWYFLFE